MGYALRPVTEKDYAFLYDLHAATIRDAVEATWGWDEQDQRRRFAESWDPAGRHVIVIGGQDAGTVTLWDAGAHVDLDLIEIGPAFQGRGWGTRIISDIVRAAHETHRPVQLSVLRANPRARALYERLGFRVVEEQPERLIMRCAVGHLTAGG